MNARWILTTAMVAAIACSAGSARAADKPRITRADAEKTALTRVPGGTVKEAELETEHGKLVWSFDIAQKSSPDIIEVQVDAKTGEIVAMETETPADQAKEAAKDAKEHK